MSALRWAQRTLSWRAQSGLPGAHLERTFLDRLRWAQPSSSPGTATSAPGSRSVFASVQFCFGFLACVANRAAPRALGISLFFLHPVSRSAMPYLRRGRVAWRGANRIPTCAATRTAGSPRDGTGAYGLCSEFGRTAFRGRAALCQKIPRRTRGTEEARYAARGCRTWPASILRDFSAASFINSRSSRSSCFRSALSHSLCDPQPTDVKFVGCELISRDSSSRAWRAHLLDLQRRLRRLRSEHTTDHASKYRPDVCGAMNDFADSRHRRDAEKLVTCASVAP